MTLVLRRAFPLMVMLAAAGVNSAAQAPARPALISPEVHADRRVTFRFRSPNAAEVMLSLEGTTPRAMHKDDQGVWSITTDPLEPDVYGYSFMADAARMVDPSNPVTKPNLLNLSSLVHVPGPSSLPWEVRDVPRGTVQHHFYRSAVVGDYRDFYVYTPPGYDAPGRRVYPVLYLLHGYSDDASAWTAVGRAHVILDNLIADGRAKPMVVVMPLGYGAPEIVSPGFVGIRDPALRRRSYEKFRDALFTEVMPRVEKAYTVGKGQESRAIAGLSMGGAESLFVGLNALDRFSWIGAFSTGGIDEDLGAVFPALDAQANTRLRLLWIACGTADSLIETNRKLQQFLASKQVQHTAIETEGAHTWMVWRRNLAALAPLLFTDAPGRRSSSQRSSRALR